RAPGEPRAPGAARQQVIRGVVEQPRVQRAAQVLARDGLAAQPPRGRFGRRLLVHAATIAGPLAGSAWVLLVQPLAARRPGVRGGMEPALTFARLLRQLRAEARLT